MMGIANSYTMEASFAGSLLGAKAETHFSTQDYEQMGRAFCQTLLDFYDEDPRKVFSRYLLFLVLVFITLLMLYINYSKIMYLREEINQYSF